MTQQVWGKGHPVQAYEPRITEQQYRALLHQPKLVDHMTKIGNKGAGSANELALIEGAEYGILVQNDPGTRRARVYVCPVTAEGTLDDAYHSTLYKVAGMMRGM